ncbi:receptor-interacting serine/threonine-protein kinase 2 isoform X2 [Anguilla rostrata]|uniref:receptor-interacting serine/threonine-protein kinase 2 isoform X2 n=1 Tax=Anguilla rostrata TaxID=7938 RepID=UPI0030CE5EEB
MEHSGCVNICNLTSTLPVIPYRKLTDLHYLSRGGFGTVFRAQHSDWRTTVAIKCLKLDSPVGERERNCLLREAEVLHKARFNYIIQIFGVCNEPEFFCIVTEFMSNGSLDQFLHEKDLYPQLAWSLRLRVLYEIALGVNFLHNMTPPLLHHDLKTQNILLDAELHVKIADFGLSKWRQLSISKASGSKPPEMGGTVIYMPPEKYEPSQTRPPDVKHDMYSYAIIMWEVLSRRIPFEEATNPMQIMFSVLRGNRPDTGPDSLDPHIPCRETLVDLITRGWTANPDERPSFLQCLIELEPMMRRFDEVEVLEAVLQVKRAKALSRFPATSACAAKKEEKTLNAMKEASTPWPDTSSASGSFSSQEAEMSQPGFLTISSAPSSKEGQRCSPDPFCKQVDLQHKLYSNKTDPSLVSHPLEYPKSLVDPGCESFEDNLDCQTARPVSGPNIPFKRAVPEESVGDSQFSCLSLKPRPLATAPPFSPPLATPPGPAAQWIQARREEVVRQMTEACLNQSLDALLARDFLMREDYELVSNQITRTAKVRQLLDTCDRQSEDFCRVVVRKLQENKQMGLQPFPEFPSPTPTPTSTAPTATYVNSRNVF